MKGINTMEDVMREGFEKYVGPSKEEVEEWKELKYKKYGRM